MSQQKNKKDNRDSDYGNSTDTQTTGAGKTENANAIKDERLTTDYRTHLVKKMNPLPLILKKELLPVLTKKILAN
ncbi:MAG: hypothetical protein IPL74_14035 [Bacteroidetes bacterium]|nr:hypothetical protein [Bacteroidota bacterium]